MPKFELLPARNRFFGQQELLNAIHDWFSNPPFADRTAPSTYYLTGSSGSGKTAVALEYAYRYRESYQALFFLHAASNSYLMSSFLHMMNLLKLPGQLGSQRHVILTVQDWLQAYPGWLLIFDNVGDHQAFREFLPIAGSGDVLVTSRMPLE